MTLATDLEARALALMPSFFDACDFVLPRQGAASAQRLHAVRSAAHSRFFEPSEETVTGTALRVEYAALFESLRSSGSDVPIFVGAINMASKICAPSLRSGELIDLYRATSVAVKRDRALPYEWPGAAVVERLHTFVHSGPFRFNFGSAKPDDGLVGMQIETAGRILIDLAVLRARFLQVGLEPAVRRPALVRAKAPAEPAHRFSGSPMGPARVE